MLATQSASTVEPMGQAGRSEAATLEHSQPNQAAQTHALCAKHQKISEDSLGKSLNAPEQGSVGGYLLPAAVSASLQQIPGILFNAATLQHIILD